MQDPDIITKYNEELKEDMVINDLNLKDVSMKLPGIKHKWVARLINHKQELNKLKRLQKLAKEKAMEEIKNTSQLTLSNPVIEAKAENSELCKKLQPSINEQYIIIEYLEKVETIFRSMTYDVSNIIKIIELETN